MTYAPRSQDEVMTEEPGVASQPERLPADDERIHPVGSDHVDTSQPGHADTGTAAGVGGVTGAAIGGIAGPLGAAIGAVGGMIVGAAAERAMHTDDDKRVEHEHASHEHAEVREPRLEIDHGDTVPPA